MLNEDFLKNKLIIGDASPFLRLPINLDQKQRVILDGLRYAIQISGIAYARLEEVLEKIYDSTKSGNQSLLFTIAFSEAWTIIDSTYRIRGLVQQIPGAKEHPITSSFISNTDSIKKMRDVIQHLPGTAEKLASNRDPVWGIITWVTLVDPENYQLQLHSILPGAVIYDKDIPIENPAGKTLRKDKKINLVKLHHHSQQIEIDKILRETENLCRLLEDYLLSQNLPSEYMTDIHAGAMFTGNKGT